MNLKTQFSTFLLLLTLLVLFHPSTSDNIPCTNDATCTKLSFYAECSPSGVCQCKPAYILSTDKTRCINPRGSTCSQASQCGAGATCGGSGTCICKFGYLPSSSNQGECQEVNCQPNGVKDNTICLRYFGNYSTCSWSSCSCQSSFKADELTQKCVPQNTPIGQPCIRSKYQCGSNANCSPDGYCHCDQGKVPKPDQQNCETGVCTTNSFCENLDSLSECRAGACECKSNYEVDYFSQKCDKSFEVKTWQTLGYVFGGLFGAAILGSIPFIIWIRARNRASGRPGVVNPGVIFVQAPVNTIQTSPDFYPNAPPPPPPYSTNVKQ